MIILIVLLSAVLTAIFWMVFMPVDLRINSDRGLYVVSQPGTMKISFHPGETPAMRVRVFGFSVVTRQQKSGSNAGAPERKAKASVITRPLHAWLDLCRRIFNSFRCKRFICCIDFDDVVLNAQLFPIAYMVSHGPVVLNVNFEKRYQLDVWVRGRVHRMLWAFIRFYLTK